MMVFNEMTFISANKNPPCGDWAFLFGILLLETDILSKKTTAAMDADTGVWDLDELNAVDMQLASTPKAKKLSQRKKRGSLMSRIENQTPSNVEMDENAAYKNRSSSVVIDSDDEEMLRSLSIFLLDGSQHQLRVLPTTTAAQCIVMLREILALQNDSHFALFEVKNGLLRGLFEVIPENEKILPHAIVEKHRRIQLYWIVAL